MPFVPGWTPDYAIRARASLSMSGRYCLVAPPTKAPRPAVSLSRYRLNYYLQGQAGTCWLHSPKQLFEVTGKAKGLDVFSVCRRALGYPAKQLYEDKGNPSDGGSPTDAMRVMTAQAVGVAHEALLPYSDDYQTLAMPPPASVYADAAKTHLVSPVAIANINQIIQMIDANRPVANGFPCPATMEKSDTFLTSIGGIMGGHSMLIWGYMLPGVKDQYTWLEFEGWWDKIYAVLPPSLAKLVDGYDPVTQTRTTSKWVRSDVYLQLCAMDGGNAEHISGTDLDGLTGGGVVPVPGYDPLSDAFPI